MGQLQQIEDARRILYNAIPMGKRPAVQVIRRWISGPSSAASVSTADQSGAMSQQHAAYGIYTCLTKSTDSSSVGAAVSDLGACESAQLGVHTFVQHSRQRRNTAYTISASEEPTMHISESCVQAAQPPWDEPPREQLNDPLLSRCESLLDNWSTLAGVGNEIVRAFRTATSRIGFVPPNAARRNWLGRTRAGAPVEFLESISSSAAGPAFLCDPAPPSASHATRIDVALERTRALLNEAGLASDRLDTLVQVANATEIWLGAQANTRTVHLLMMPLERGRASARTAHTWLCNAGIECPFSTRRSLALAADAGRLRTIAYDFQHTEGPICHATFCHPIDLDVISLAAACGIPGEPFARYFARVLRAGAGAVDRRAQVTLTVSASGNVSEFAISHYTAPYFRTDDDLRAAILSNASTFDWRSAPYRSATRLVGSSLDGTRARCYMQLGVTQSGRTHLGTYASPARLFFGSTSQRRASC